MRYRTTPRSAYQAARFERREELIENEKLLAEHNIISNTQWLYIESDPTGTATKNNTDEERAQHAELDVENVLNNDFLIYYSEDITEERLPVVIKVSVTDPAVYDLFVPALWARGGRHVEFGIALATYMHIVVIGPPENIFHYYAREIGGEPQIRHFDTIEEFVQWYDENNVLPDDAEMPNNEAPPA